MSFNSLKEWAEAALAPHASTMLAAMQNPLSDDTYNAVAPILGGAVVMLEAVRSFPEGFSVGNPLMTDLGNRARLQPSHFTLTERQARAVANCLRHALRGGTGTFPTERVKHAAAPAEAPAKATYDRSTKAYICYTCKESLIGIDALYEHREKEHGVRRPSKAAVAPPVSSAVLPKYTPTLNLDLRTLPDGRYALEAKDTGLGSPWFVIKRTVKRPYSRTGRFLWGRAVRGYEYVEAGRIEVRVQRGDTKQLIGEQKASEAVYYGESEAFLELILKDPTRAMEIYGRLLGVCAHCGRSLTDDLSRLRGIGPDCWEHKHIPFSRALAARR